MKKQKLCGISVDIFLYTFRFSKIFSCMKKEKVGESLCRIFLHSYRL